MLVAAACAAYILLGGHIGRRGTKLTASQVGTQLSSIVTVLGPFYSPLM